MPKVRATARPHLTTLRGTPSGLPDGADAHALAGFYGSETGPPLAKVSATGGGHGRMGRICKHRGPPMNQDTRLRRPPLDPHALSAPPMPTSCDLRALTCFCGSATTDEAERAGVGASGGCQAAWSSRSSGGLDPTHVSPPACRSHVSYRRYEEPLVPDKVLRDWQEQLLPDDPAASATLVTARKWLPAGCEPDRWAGFRWGRRRPSPAGG